MQEWIIVIRSVLVMLSVSLFMGIMIAIFARVFEVKVDPRVTEINEVLPAYNCGACGYPGCINYADAIVENGELTTKCKPGGPDVATAIKEVMAKEVPVVEKVEA